MALINNLYVHVIDEKITSSIESTTHPIENGLDITDTIRAKPKQISLSGKIVKVGHAPANYFITSLESLMKGGSLVEYKGRNYAKNMQIQSFNHSHPNTITGGCDFDMVLQEVKIAQPSYKTSTSSTAKTPTTPTTATINVGDIVVFKGGRVYVSSDAKSPTANRNQSTCKVTLISTASWSTHKYHLISTDGGKVYGWVDKANIQTKSTTTTNATTSKSTQQVTNGSETAVYHTVKKGDTVYSLVNNNYKSLGKTVQWVVDNNPDCFSKKGDVTTLIVGKKLLMGYKS